jgi:hypothetical protein
MDAAGVSAYLAAAMDRTLRLFLTLLAVLTGFTVAPAQARMAPADAAELERVESGGRGNGGASAIAVQAAEVQGQATKERRDRERIRPRAPAKVIVLIPSIQYGDRLLE